MCNGNLTTIIRFALNANMKPITAYLQGAGFGVQKMGSQNALRVTVRGGNKPTVLPPSHRDCINRMMGIIKVEDIAIE